MSIKKLNRLKQSIWVDHLSRDYLNKGCLEEHIKQGVSGVTSNPSILYQSIVNSDAYDEDIKGLVGMGKDSLDIYDELIRLDVRVAASILRAVYVSTDRRDGYVSIEVDPAFANRVDATVYQGAYLHNLIDCPNIMIKVPGTDSGIEAFKRLIFDGINVNVTLLFSVDQYEKVAWAYIEALEERKSHGLSLDTVASVASFFISRIDVAINNTLESHNGDIAKRREEFWGKSAIASAALAYKKWGEIFHSTRFLKLSSEGARSQRLLWASTSNKYPDEDPLKYVMGLIAPETINTLPLKTLDTTIKCGEDHWCEGHWYSYVLTDTESAAQGHFDELKRLRIDIHEYTDRLLKDGIQLFAESFDDLMSCLYDCTRERGEYASRNSKLGSGLV